MFMNITIVFAIVLSSCMQTLDTEKGDLYGTWHHSVEEQTDEVLVFRPEGYELPRARGRESMTFKENGDYIYRQIAPEDGYVELKGTFTLHDKENELFVTYTKDNEKYTTYYKIVELTRNFLRIKMFKP